MKTTRLSSCLLLVGSIFSISAFSTIVLAGPYVPVVTPPGAVPGIGPGIIAPSSVFGKEYTHDLDHDAMGVLSPEQIVAWDGSAGAADGIDIKLFPRPTYPPESQIDAIANHNDALFTTLRQDRSHLIFSHDDFFTQYLPGPGGPVPFSSFAMPATGPIPLSGGGVIGGSAELSIETAGAFGLPVQTLWAPAPIINGMVALRDIDGVEVWGPEPGFVADTDKYSIDLDIMTGSPVSPATSVWNLSGSTYIDLPTIKAAVESVLGPITPTAYLPRPDGENLREIQAFNLDALMVRDTIGDIDRFDGLADGSPGDQIIFSIRQIVDPADPTGYYATGSELFVLDATTGPLGTTYLFHGGHFWSKAYADLALRVGPGGPFNGRGVIDINAIESVGNQVVPEPATLLLMGLGLATVVALRRVRS